MRTPSRVEFLHRRAHLESIDTAWPRRDRRRLGRAISCLGAEAAGFLRDFSDSYFTTRHENEWGDAINFDDDDAGPVREFFLENAIQWIDEYQFDGLRLDATQAINDSSPEHLVAEICRRVREAAGGRHLVVMAENEPQDAMFLRGSAPGRHGVDALWNNDFHHAAIVALTGRREAYYTDYLGTPQEFVSMARHGFLYQGQWYSWQTKPRGTPTMGVRSSAFVTFLENHDQVANSGLGARPHQRAHPGAWRALTAHLLLGPGVGPLAWSSDDFAYDGPGRVDFTATQPWRIPAYAAYVLRPAAH